MISYLYQTEWQEKNKKSFDYYTNTWLKFASQITPTQDVKVIMSEMTRLLTGFEFIYWNDEHRQEFIEKLSGIKKALSSFNSSSEIGEHQIKLTLTKPNVQDRAVIFDVMELSNISYTLKNKIASTMNDFGQSVSYEERIQVLLSLLGDIAEKE